MSQALEPLLADGVIDAVLGQLKAGKEAEVWLVQHADSVVAAKVYKERHARNFRNNVGYREGRQVRSSRTQRAIDKGSRFGQAAAEEAWKSAEADAIYTLHAAGVRVPAPVMFYEGVLLMELVVAADGGPAPRLVEAPPATPDEAHAMYLDLRAQVVRMLAADLIHGDLSPYNILMAAGGPTLIDFPQTIAAARNNQAERYFRRDLDNVREFLARVDSRLHAMRGDSAEIWNAYVKRELSPDFVPSSRRAAPRAFQAPTHPPRRQHETPAAFTRPTPQALRSGPDLDPEEAELRALEAQILRQGGGERGRPFVPDTRGERGRGGNRARGGRGGGQPVADRRPSQGRPNDPQRRNGGGPNSQPRGGTPDARNPQRRTGGGPNSQPRGGAPDARNPQRRNDGGANPSRRGAPDARNPQRRNDGGANQQRGGAPDARDRREGTGPDSQQRGSSPDARNQQRRSGAMRRSQPGDRPPRNGPQRSAPQVSYVSRPAGPSVSGPRRSDATSGSPGSDKKRDA